LLTELRALRGRGAGTPTSGAIDEADAALQARLEGPFGVIGLGAVVLTSEITEEMAGRFWEAGGDLASVRVEPHAVAMPDAILRELGASGLAVGGHPLEDLLAPAYRAIAAAAVRIAAGEPEDGAPLDPDPPVPPKPRSSGVRTRAPRRPERGPSRDRLEHLIADATVDCYNESEKCTGLFTMLAEHLEIPFVTTVLGVAVTVIAVELTASDEIVAVCRRGRDLLRVALLELPMPDPRPGGAEWVDAYREWARPG
jgi:hypothetical protein